MAEAYWRYGDRQAAMPPPMAAGKRSRPDYDIIPSGGLDMHGYFSREEERAGHRMTRDTESIGASYDRYLRNGQISSYGASETSNLGVGGFGRPVSGGMSGHLLDDAAMVGMDSGMAGKGRGLGFGGRPEMLLPPDATNTLFVEGLPAGCTRREVAHIFRPFVGFKEVRLVNKEAKQPGRDPLILCFVDFTSANHAAVALDAIRGYKFDEQDRDSPILKLQFARYPGPRTGGGSRGRR